MSITIDFYGFEITAILSWYTYVQNNTVSIGGSNPKLPMEKAIVNKLKNNENEAVVFSVTELEIMCGWINRVICSKYGSSEKLYGYDRRAYIKLMACNGVHHSCA